LAVSLTRAPVKLDGLPLGFGEALTLEYGAYGPSEIKKALADTEIVASLLRKYPDEMAGMINDALAGRHESAKAVARKIGFSEEAFKEQEGGYLFCAGIILFGAFILGYAAFHEP